MISWPPSKDTNKISDIVLNDIKEDLTWYVNSEVENLKAFVDNKFTTIKKSVKDLKRKIFIIDNMSLVDSLMEELAYLKKENINKTEVIKSLTDKIKLLHQHFCKMKIQIATLMNHWQITKR